MTEAVIAPAESVAAEPAKPRKPYLFTQETAKAMQARAQAAIKARKEREAATLKAAADAAEAAPKPKPEPEAQPAPAQVAPTSQGFTIRRLERVRLQLERVDAMLAEETDPARIDKLCAASSKLEEQERRLSDRSLPPVRRAQDQAPPKLGHGSSLITSGLDGE